MDPVMEVIRANELNGTTWHVSAIPTTPQVESVEI